MKTHNALFSRRRGHLVSRTGAFLMVWLAACGAVLAQAPAARPPGERLLLFVGSNTLGESAVPELVKAYLEQEKKVASAKIEARGSLLYVSGVLPDGSAVYAEIHATGSGDCFKSLTGNYPAAGDRCDIGMSSRVVKEEEADLMIEQLGTDLHERGTEPGSGCEHPVALDGLAIVVHRDNPLVRISFGEIADIYSRRITDWKDLKEWKSSSGPEGDQAVVALRRKEPSGTLDFFKDKIKPADGPMADEKQIRAFTSSRDLAREVAGNPRAIGFIGESYAELPGLKRLQVYDNSPTMAMEADEAVFPDRIAVRMGLYPLTRLVYLYTAAVTANPEVRPFIRFALSEAGQSIIADKGNLVKVEGTSNHITSWGEDGAVNPPPSAAGQKKARVILRLHGSNTVGAECAVNLAINYFMVVSQDSKSPPAIDDRTREIETPEGEKALEHDVTCDVDGDGTPEVIEIRPTGSSDGFRDLNQGKCDVGMSSRAISAAERRDLMDNCGNLEKPGAQFALGLDAMAIIVSKDNPVEKLTVQQLRRIFLGELVNWSEAGGPDLPIRLHARPDRSGTYKHFSDAVLQGRSVPAGATRHAENALLAERVAADPGGIGFVPGANAGPAKVLKMGQEGSTTYCLPGEDDVRAGKYPAALCRYVYFYVPEEKPESPDVLARRNWQIAREFAEMSQNWRGQAIIASSGFITETTTNDEAGQARRIAGEPIKKYLERLRVLEKKVRLRQIKMTPKLVNDEICPQLLFGFNQDVLTPESRNLIDKKLGPWLEMYPEIAKGGLVAEGWADSVGSDEACLELSLKRARNVADYISKTHRCKVTAVGKGKSFDPPNTSEENKQRNRRVVVKRAVAAPAGSAK